MTNLYLFHIKLVKITLYKTVKEKLSNALLAKLKATSKNSTEVTLRLSSNMIGNSNHGNPFSHKLLLTDRHVFTLHNRPLPIIYVLI